MPLTLLIDGDSFPGVAGHRHTCVVKGDSLHAEIALASIVAKTERDGWIASLAATHAEESSRYDLARNKGYPTKRHRDGLARFGPWIPFHRMSYAPVARHSQ